MKEENRLLMVILIWSLWSERNSVREEGRQRNADTLARSIRLYAAKISKTQGGGKMRTETSKEKWSRRPEGVLKLNYDASYLANSNTGSWGFILHNSDGDVVLSGRGIINHLLSAFHAEVIAALQGVQAAVNLGVSRLILKTDALILQQELASEAYRAKPKGELVQELKSLNSTNFSFFVCLFKRRECNRVAHALAELGYACSEGEELISSSIPDIVNVFVAADLLADE